MKLIFIFILFLIHVCFGFPQGFTTFFLGDACPPNWVLLNETQGRLILSTDDGSNAGISLNPPLADQEDRQHAHGWSSLIDLPSKSVSAIGCCDDESCQSGTYPVSGDTTSSTSGYPFLQLILCSFLGDSSTPPAQVPFGTVAYFHPKVATCPPGWAPFTQSSGRYLVGSGETGSPTVISPNGAQEVGQDASSHVHFFATQFDTVDQTFSGLAGCCNGGPSAQGTVEVSGDSYIDATGVPYYSLLTCTQQNSTVESDLPDQALLFNIVQCPEGYVLATDQSGYLLVSLPSNGTAEAAFGSPTKLSSDNLTPSHFHYFSGSFSPPSAGVGLVAGCCTGGYAHSQEYSFSGSTNPQTVDIPFLLLSLCIKK